MKEWKLTAGKKIGLSIGLIFFLVLTMSLLARTQLTAIQKLANQISKQRSPSVFACSNLETYLTLTQKRAVGAMLAGLVPEQGATDSQEAAKQPAVMSPQLQQLVDQFHVSPSGPPA